MKDKRNCNNMSYPIYQPMMVPPMGYPVGYPQNQGVFGGNNMSNNIEQRLNNIEQQINLLDQRVNRLENLGSNSTTNNYTKYNDSNYYMV